MIIREAHNEDAVDIAKVHVDTWRTTYAGIVPDEFLANMSYIHPRDAQRVTSK